MKYFSLIMLLMLSIICTGTDSYAAQMRYSMQFEVGSGATFNGSMVAPDTVASIELIGDTDDIDFYMIMPPDDPEMGGGFEGSDEFSLDGLNGILRLGAVEHNLSDLWYIWTYHAMGETTSVIQFSAASQVSQMTYPSGGGDIDLAIVQQLEGDGYIDRVVTDGGVLERDQLGSWGMRYESTAVPIPSAIVLLSSGLALVLGIRRKFTS